jgi:hypothetical protein
MPPRYGAQLRESTGTTLPFTKALLSQNNMAVIIHNKSYILTIYFVYIIPASTHRLCLLACLLACLLHGAEYYLKS